jgi:tripartite ATP-independent transporter DctM subunit
VADFLAPAMFLSLVIVLLVGFPVAFSLAAVAGIFGGIGILTGDFKANFLLAMTLRVQGTFFNDNLLAIPLLVFMGMILERAGLAEDMFEGLHRLFGHMPGGLAYAVIVVGAVLSAVTGFVSAAVIALGLIAMPAMLRAGYDHRLAAGAVAAGGTLAQVMPPSLVLIVLAEQLEVSLIEIYRGALLPALLLIGLYLGYIYVLTRRHPNLAPPAAHGAADTAGWAVWRAAAASAALPIGLMVAVLLSIYFGVATPSEGGAIGVTGALLLALVKGRLTFRRLHGAMMAAGILCSSVIFLLFGASFFTLVFRGLEGHVWIEEVFRHLPAGQIGFLIILNVAIFLLAFFLDFFEIAFIVLPLIGPIARGMGVDMVWLAVVIAVNLQTSFMHPPFGIALYNLRSVTPRTVATASIYWGAVPFIALQLSVVAALIAAPQLVVQSKPASSDSNRNNIELPPPPSDP